MNILTIDLEDWFHILDHPDTARPDQWMNFESRLERNVERLLTVLENHKVQRPGLSWMDSTTLSSKWSLTNFALFMILHVIRMYMNCLHSRLKNSRRIRWMWWNVSKIWPEENESIPCFRLFYHRTKFIWHLKFWWNVELPLTVLFSGEQKSWRFSAFRNSQTMQDSNQWKLSEKFR